MKGSERVFREFGKAFLDGEPRMGIATRRLTRF